VNFADEVTYPPPSAQHPPIQRPFAEYPNQPNFQSNYPPTYAPSTPAPASETYTDIIEVPTKLGAFIGDPSFQQALVRVKDQSNISRIIVERDTHRLARRLYVESTSVERAMLARKLLEIHFKEQMKLHMAEARFQKVHMHVDI
jgi:hypothetical protein